MSIPIFAVVRYRRPHSQRVINLWLPLFLIWILLLPLVLILLPFVLIAMLVVGMRPFHSLGARLRVLGSVAGTAIEVDSPKALVSIRIL